MPRSPLSTLGLITAALLCFLSTEALAKTVTSGAMLQGQPVTVEFTPAHKVL